MRIAFIDTLGLCYDGDTLKLRGLGGSESAVIYLSKQLSDLGFDVTIFNDCESDDTRPGVYNGVEYRPLRDVEIDFDFDVVVASRSVAPFAPYHMRTQFKHGPTLPNFEKIVSNANWKVLWMHDTFCDGDNHIEAWTIEGKIDEIFTLSDWHTSYVTNCEHGGVRRNFDILKNKIFQTRNGIGIVPDWIDLADKDPNLFVYNSSITKGMIPLVKKAWPRIKQHIPEAKLKVIGGYYRFRSHEGPDQQEKDWHDLVNQPHQDIEFTGIITQQEISDILRIATFLLYPAAFPETYGISTIEAIAHNVTPITCRFGALEETAIDMASYKIPYTVERNWSCPWLSEEDQIDRFVELTVQAYQNKYLQQQKANACNQLKGILGWDSVAIQWAQHLVQKTGEFMPASAWREAEAVNFKVQNVFGRRFADDIKREPKSATEKRIVVITPVYNAHDYIENCILSVAQQDYDNYRMIIIDDCSTDGTAELAQDVINNLPIEVRDKFQIVIQDENRGAVYNQFFAINSTIENREDIFMLLDGDDWLVNNPYIFQKYNNLYRDGAEFTYGSCWSLVDKIPLIAQEYPPIVKVNKWYRNYRFAWNMPYTHLRTFKGSLWSKITLKDVTGPDNKIVRAGGDGALFYALIEAADPKGVVVVTDVVYNYNDINPLNDYKVNSEEQTKTAEFILGKK